MDVYSLPVPGSGGKTCSQIFEEAGCDTPASPSCGACLGGPKDTYARLNEPKVSLFLNLQHIRNGHALMLRKNEFGLSNSKKYVFGYWDIHFSVLLAYYYWVPLYMNKENIFVC